MEPSTESHFGRSAVVAAPRQRGSAFFRASRLRRALRQCDSRRASRSSLSGTVCSLTSRVLLWTKSTSEPVPLRPGSPERGACESSQ